MKVCRGEHTKLVAVAFVQFCVQLLQVHKLIITATVLCSPLNNPLDHSHTVSIGNHAESWLQSSPVNLSRLGNVSTDGDGFSS